MDLHDLFSFPFFVYVYKSDGGLLFVYLLTQSFCLILLLISFLDGMKSLDECFYVIT